MNVLVVTPYYPSDKDPDRGLFIHEQVLALKRKGINPRVLYLSRWLPSFVSARRRSLSGAQAPPPTYVWDGVPVFTLRTPILPRHHLIHISGKCARLSFWKRISPGFSLEDIDIIHAHELFPTGQLATGFASEYNVPLILTIHGTDGTGRSYATSGRRSAIRRIISQAAAVVYVGSQMVPTFGTFGVDKDKTVIITNGIDPHKRGFSANRPLGWRDKYLVVSVSNLTESKGIADNLRALAQVKKDGLENAHYVVIGDGRHRERFEKLASTLCVEESVTFVGRLPNRRAMEFISMADIFSLPSTNEAFGVVYLEAMLLGKPAIGIAGQGPTNVIRDGSTGFLVPPGDPDELARVWRRLADDPPLRLAVGRRARSHVLNHYSWDSNAKATIDLYTAAADRDLHHRQ